MFHPTKSQLTIADRPDAPNLPGGNLPRGNRGCHPFADKYFRIYSDYFRIYTDSLTTALTDRLHPWRLPRATRLRASGRDGIGFTLPGPKLGQRRREVLEELVRDGVFGRRGRHHAGGSHDVMAVGKWLVDPCFAEQFDPGAERRHRFKVLVGQRVVGVVDSNALLSRQISGRAGDSVAFELLLQSLDKRLTDIRLGIFCGAIAPQGATGSSP
jgi:hypothetical protein